MRSKAVAVCRATVLLSSPASAPTGTQTQVHRLRAIGVQSRSSTAVTGVHGGQQVHHLRAAALTDHEPIRAHTQRLHNQLTQPDFAGAFGVGGAGFEGNNLLMLRREFRGVFDRDEALLRRTQPQQGIEQGGFAGAGAPLMRNPRRSAIMRRR